MMIIGTYNELQWLVLDISSNSGLETIREICQCAFQQLEEARVITAMIVLDGVPFLEEFGFPHHQYKHEQKNRMKQDLATIHQQFSQIEALNGF